MYNGELNFPQKESLLKALFRIARKQEFFKDTNMVKNALGKYNLMLLLEFALNEIEEEDRRIINNDFKKGKHENWWITYYSRSTYYRAKAQAMTKFLNYIHY